MEGYFELKMKLYKSRHVFLFSTVIFFNSCSLMDEGSIAPGYVEAFNAIQSTLIKKSNETLTPELINNIPYASGKLSIGRGAEGLVILESKKDLRETWVSADGVYIVTSGGRIVQTIGLENNLSEIFSSYRALDYYNYDSLNFFAYYSFSNPKLDNLKVKVSVNNAGYRTLDLFDGKRRLLAIEETIENTKLGWREKNLFFFDDEGSIIKSIQHISPRLPEIYFEVTKKPAL